MTQAQQLPEDTRKQIEKEADEAWPKHLFESGTQRRAYIYGATNYALACIQKDEKIARLRNAISEIVKEIEHLEAYASVRKAIYIATEALKQ